MNLMVFCSNCEVGLEDDMLQCPLCGTSVTTTTNISSKTEPLVQSNRTRSPETKEKYLLQRILWQVTSILLFSGIISTLIIDLAVHRGITWSIYPVTICMIIFSYVSLFAFWNSSRIYQVITGLIISALLFVALELLLPRSNWPLQLGLPILCATNLAAIILMTAIDRAKHRGLNVIAYSCVAIAVLCIGLESIISFYKGTFVLGWSIIVAACMLPVTAALLFMHYRIKRNPEVKKIFHT